MVISPERLKHASPCIVPAGRWYRATPALCNQAELTFLICKRHNLIAELLPLTLVMLIIMLHNHKLKTLVTWFRFGYHCAQAQEEDPDHTSGHSIRLIICKDGASASVSCISVRKGEQHNICFENEHEIVHSCLMRFLSTGIM